MPRRFIAAGKYTETVKGEPQDFVHETMIEATDLNAANKLARQSGVG